LLSPIDVLIDGELYGPFQKLRISPCLAAPNEPLALNFMTYLPRCT
jgi:hypothetical protein